MQNMQAQVSRLPIKLNSQNLNFINLVPKALTAVKPDIIAIIKPPAI
jgi:hypothetical protein